MDTDEALPDERELVLAYLKLCERIYRRMERENSWPWVVDSEGYERSRGDFPNAD